MANTGRASQTHWREVHALQHRAFVDQVKADCTHLGDTPDGTWGLFAPRDQRREPTAWLNIHVVRYVLPIDRRWDAMILTHNGSRFGGSLSYQRMLAWYPDTVATWNAALCKLYALGSHRVG